MTPLAAGWLGALVLASIGAGAFAVFKSHPLQRRDMDAASQTAAQVTAGAMAWGMVVSGGLVSGQLTPAVLAGLAATIVLVIAGVAWAWRASLPEGLAPRLCWVGAVRLGLALAPVPTAVRIASLVGGGAQLSAALGLHTRTRAAHLALLASLGIDLAFGLEAAQRWPGAWWPLWLLPLWALSAVVGATGR